MSNTQGTQNTPIDNETERQFNSYEEYVSAFAEGFMTKLFSHGIITEVEPEQLKKYFANPDQYQKELENLAQYFYISNGEVFQLFELVETLPSLNYKINVFDKVKNYEKNLALCNKALYRVKYKSLTRDILKQEVTAGTLVGMWLGDRKNPYPYIFDNLKYIFPAYRSNSGDWIAVVDLAWFDTLSEYERNMQFNNLSPYITKQDYETFKKNQGNTQYQYKELPEERTFVLRTHTNKRNQRLGLSWALTGLYDILHKNKLKNMEKSVANKIINALAVLKIGSDKNPEYANLKLNKNLKKKVHSGVKTALEKNQANGVTVVAIPDFASIEFPDMKSDALDGKKFDSINSDILSSYGLSQTVLSGDGGNFSSSKINYDIIYKRIGKLLEDIEREVFGKLFNLILPVNQKDNYYMEYEKEVPLDAKTKIDTLMKLHAQEGFSLKAVIDLLAGVDFADYISQSIFEQEEMELKSRIVPYASAYTGGSNGESGRPALDDSNVTNDNTAKSKGNDSNNVPS